MQVPALSELLAYKNRQVIDYYIHHHPDVSSKQATVLFSDLLAWLWLNAYRESKGKHTYFFGPLLILDDIWHAFILHTRDYAEFCKHFFIDYFHHDIELIGSQHELTPEEIEDFLNDCFNFLGEDWVKRYFADLLF